MTTAIAAHEPVEEDADDGHDDVFLAVAKMNALAGRDDTAPVEMKPRWRHTEEEIVRAVIAVILVVLVVVIGVGAISAMG